MKNLDPKDDLGMQVRIINITDNDKDLNGRTGILTRPVRDQRPIQALGVRLDANGDGTKEEYININRNEYELI